MIISVILGILLGIIIIKIILYINSKKFYHGPDSKEIIKNIYYINNKYYKFYPEICICPIV